MEGIWITDLAAQLSPSATLQGIDIETSLVPPTLPPNVTISHNTITKLPTEWTNRFDLVHQRLLMAALQTPEWVSAIAEMHRVVRPGGWVELTEAGDFDLGNKILSDCQEKLVTMIRKVYAARKLCFDLPLELPKMLEAAGFCSVKSEKRYIPLGRKGGEVGTIHRYTLGEVFRAMKAPILQAGGLGIVDSEKAYDELMDDVESDWDNNVGNGASYFTIVAQKPDSL